MKKNIFLLISFLFIFNHLFAQVNKDGIPFLTKYTDKDYGDAGQFWAITQDSRGVMYFGCNYGLKTYDGKSWKNYAIPQSTILRSLNTDKDGNVFYGAEGDFGVIVSDSAGNLNFHSLYLDKFSGDTIDFDAVWKVLFDKNKVYFQTFNKLFYINLPLKFQNDSLINEIKIIKPNSLFHASFSVNDKFYIREWEKGLCEIKNDKLELVPGGENFAFLRIYIMLPLSDTKILVGTRETGFYIWDTTKKKNAFIPFVIENNDEILKSAIYSSSILPDGNIVIGTYSGGLYIINKEGKLINHFSKNIGLPEAFVSSVYYNEKSPSQLWFVMQDNGIYKIDIDSPFRLWNEFKGVKSIPNDIIRFNNKIYLAASPYLYVLDEKNARFKKIYTEDGYFLWKFFKYKHSNDKTKLLLGSVSGVYEIINDTLVKRIAEARDVKAFYKSEKYPDKLFIGTAEGLKFLTFKNEKWSKPQNIDFVTDPVQSIFEINRGLLLGLQSKGCMLIKNLSEKKRILIDSARGLPLVGSDFFIKKIKNNTVIISGAGLYNLTESDSVEKFDVFGKDLCSGQKGVYTFYEDNDAYWMSVYNNDAQNLNHRLLRFFDKKKLKRDSVFAKLLPQKSTLCIYGDGNYVWIGNEGGLFKFNKLIQKNYKQHFNTIITRVLTENDSLLFNGYFSEIKSGKINTSNVQDESRIPVLKFKSNMLSFEWAAPFYEKENETEYSFRLLGQSDKWSKWSGKTDTRYTNLYEGDYTFEVKARNIYNTESTVAQYKFTILPPWYRTYWAYLIFFVAGVLLIMLIIKLYTKKLKRENEKLEQIVKERTAEIRMQNEEITAQRDEIQAQKEQVEKAKDKIEKQQKSIMDSIHYASRIQEAVLPPDEYINEILGEHFVLFRPRDIVSGDFYWATKRGNKTVIVAADCTGHGVPGAFMSMLGMSFLNEIVNKEGILQANIILNRLRENVKKSLRQTGKENEAKDGMDIALCVIDKTEMKLEFAGAYNPLYIIRDGEISRIKADRMPIGIYLREKESFTNNIIDIKKGDLLYIFSDGYVDQFGGEDDSKIRSANFKKVLLDNHKQPLDVQKAELVKFLEAWMDHTDKTGRKYKQVDDILVIGIEI